MFYKRKKRLIKDIMSIIKPFMWESGYTKGNIFNTERLKLYVFPKNRYYKPRLKWTFNMADEYVGIMGFTEFGEVITDCYAAIVVNSISGMPLEDVITLHKWVKSHEFIENRPK